MRLELTISGLCIISMKSDTGPKPVNPRTLDIIVPNACHHKCRFIWSPQDHVISLVKPELTVDSLGNRYASFDMDDQALTLTTNSSRTDYYVHWGNVEKAKPEAPWEESWMDWVPKIESLGFDPIRVPDSGKLQDGAIARITLPFGTLASADIVRKNRSDEYLLWRFPAVAHKERVLANQVVFSVDGISKFDFQDASGHSVVHAEIGGPSVVRMCISNDMEKVPPNFNAPIKKLDHLSHLDVITTGTFQAPESLEVPRTGNPICDQVVNVEMVG